MSPIIPWLGIIWVRAGLSCRDRGHIARRCHWKYPSGVRRGVSAWAHAALGSVLVHGILVLIWALSADKAEPKKPHTETVTLHFVVPTTAPKPSPVLPPPPEQIPPQRRATKPHRSAEPRPSRSPSAKPRAPQPTPDSARPAAGQAGLPVPSEAPSQTSGSAPPQELDLQAHASTPEPPKPQLLFPSALAGTSLPSGPRLLPRSDGGYEIKEGQFSARIAPDGELTFIDKSAMEKWGGLSYQIDVTDQVMRALGDDPYGYQKNKIRLQTRALRAKMAKAACSARFKDSLAGLRGQLGQIWADTSKSHESRRTLLFQLWDECVEQGDPELLQYARMARETIYAFVQRELPQGSEFGFREEELKRLNQGRHSKSYFEP